MMGTDGKCSAGHRFPVLPQLYFKFKYLIYGISGKTAGSLFKCFSSIRIEQQKITNLSFVKVDPFFVAHPKLKSAADCSGTENHTIPQVN